jgi:hypothetical protein
MVYNFISKLIFSMGQFVMLQTTPKQELGKYYAAKITGWVPGARELTMEWYPGNIFPISEEPMSETFFMEIGDVLDAYREVSILQVNLILLEFS